MTTIVDYCAAARDWPMWAVMWLSAVAIYVVAKLASGRGVDWSAAPRGNMAGYFIAWPGMDPRPFARPAVADSVPRAPAVEWLFAIVKLLLDHGANPHMTDKYGKTPLELAREKGFDAIADLLLAAGA